MSEKEKTMKAAGCVEVFLELLKVGGVLFLGSENHLGDTLTVLESRDTKKSSLAERGCVNFELRVKLCTM